MGIPSIIERRGAPLDRLPPRSRVILAGVFALVVVASPVLVPAVAALVFALGLAVAARLPLATTARRVLALEGFLLVALATLPFTVPGETAFVVAGWSAGWAGLERAALIMVKATAVTLAASALLFAMEPVALGRALTDVGVPARFAQLHLMTLRYIDVIGREYRRSRHAMRARGFRPGANRHTWRALGWLIGMLLVRSAERAERILVAMRCRGFDPSAPVRSVAAE